MPYIKEELERDIKRLDQIRKTLDEMETLHCGGLRRELREEYEYTKDAKENLITHKQK
jgi:hypothetical protein